MDAPEDITHAYAIGWVKGAAMPIIELWSVAKIKKHRDKYNKVGTRHYSFRDWEMYARKIPLLQVLKYMPASIEMSNAIDISNASEAGRGATIENGIVIDSDRDDGRFESAKTVDEPQELPEMPSDKFAAELIKWRKAVAGKALTPAQIISTTLTKYVLTDDQKLAIEDLAVNYGE